MLSNARRRGFRSKIHRDQSQHECKGARIKRIEMKMQGILCLLIKGSGYKITKEGSEIKLKLGQSHMSKIAIPKGIDIRIIPGSSASKALQRKSGGEVPEIQKGKKKVRASQWASSQKFTMVIIRGEKGVKNIGMKIREYSKPTCYNEHKGVYLPEEVLRSPRLKGGR